MSLHRCHGGDTGPRRRAVDMNGAGAALRDAAAEFGASQPKLISDHPEQRRLGRDIDGMPSSIHGEIHGHRVPSLSAAVGGPLS